MNDHEILGVKGDEYRSAKSLIFSAAAAAACFAILFAGTCIILILKACRVF